MQVVGPEYIIELGGTRYVVPSGQKFALALGYNHELFFGMPVRRMRFLVGSEVRPPEVMNFSWSFEQGSNVTDINALRIWRA